MTKHVREAMVDKVEMRCFEIESNLSLDGFVSGLRWLNCDVTLPVEINGRTANYALLSQGTRFGITELGYIDPVTREFKKFDSPKNRNGLPTDVTHFESTEAGGCGRKTKMYVPASQLQYLRPLEEVLSIQGISVRK